MFLTKNLKEQTFDYIDPFGSILASIAWAVRASYNSTTESTPAQMVFGRDMIFNLQTLINWKDLSIRKQRLVDKSNLRENKNRVDYDYQIDDLVYIKKMAFIEKWTVPRWVRFPLPMCSQMVRSVSNVAPSTNVSIFVGWSRTSDTCRTIWGASATGIPCC